MYSTEAFDLGGLGLDDLLNLPLLEQITHTLSVIGRVQEMLAALQEKHDQPELLSLKIGTTLVLALLRKAQDGKTPQTFSQDDWADVARVVSDYAIEMDGHDYSEFVFTQYAKYIEASANLLKVIAPPESIDAILDLADDLFSKSEALENGEITETDYIESCLWVSAEAMLKLLCAYGSVITGPEYKEYSQLASSIAQLAFEYGRLRLYTREQELLARYLNQQYELDSRLERDYQAYLNDVQIESSRFLELVNHAFSPDIEERLAQSVLLARNVGVDSEDILDTEEDIDEFFLD